MITAEHKNRPHFQFKNYAKLIFSANEIPYSKDGTDAYFRRWIIINFPNTFNDEGDNLKNPNLTAELTTAEELSGIFNWAIEGLERLIHKGKFDSKPTEIIAEEYKRKSSPIAAFVQDCLEEDDDGVIEKEELFRRFVKYCKKNGIPTKTKALVGKILPLEINVKSTKVMINGERKICWRGISYTNEKLIFS